MTDIKEVLQERGSNYGNFHTFSNLSQSLYAIIITHYNDIQKQRGEQTQLPAFMAESLRMICHKLARIVNGNPFYADSWVDIGGYADLVVQILEAKNVAQEAQTKAPASVTELVKPQLPKQPSEGA